MAVRLNELYPGRVNAPTAAYPQGSFKNETALDAGDGTPLEQRWANDQLGFFSSLLAAAGMTPNGLIDQVGASQYFTALESVVGAAVPDATQAVKGKARFATNPESLAGLSSSIAETPAGARTQIGALALGVDQALHDMTALRSVGVTYTNTYGRTIIAIISGGRANGRAYLTLGGMQVNYCGQNVTANSYGSATLIIPPGVTYSAVNGSIDSWLEIR